MYPLGEQFKIKTNPMMNEANIIKGNKYRITILTNNLIRFEYSETGEFLDQPTEFAWNRNFNETSFQIKQDSRYLEITTTYFKISVICERSSLSSSLPPKERR